MSDVVRMYRQGEAEVLQLESEDAGAPGPGQVRLRQEAIGLNYVDTYFRNGTFPVRPLPAVIGVEAAGTVDAVGPGVTSVSPGERAGYYFAPGAYREVRLIAESQLIPLPDDIPSDVAASVLAKGLTAWARVRRVHPVGPGTLAVVTGATGGVGSLLASWASDLGAKVIAVAARPEQVATLNARGLGNVAVAGTGGLARLVAREARPVDIVYDLVGQAVFDDVASVLNEGGRLDLAGSASGEIDASLLRLKAPGVHVTRSSTGDHLAGREVLLGAADEVFGALRNGVFGMREVRRYPLADVVRAHRDVEARSAGPAPVLIP
ncbi:zinc-binding dehydrogenase [Amycolatopsis sp., V23-08]|uniref:Zinc-binding dehydrogenase n=1 Tax=Amycolatopsis heterodermiae TaxID=3110235 RepID=A0ABU5RAP9_9PSEU|nr:zinc-binding dehydrogenase [Amycolatopsis sp., V23-08]MEA5362915.1 zinc-binding dehydrogenase [Amycolatopsis sp., V23-08]